MLTKLSALLKKDLLSELRGKETILLHLALCLTLSVMAAFGVRTAFLPRQTVVQIFPLLLWIIFLFSATVAVARIVEYEFRLGALSGVLLTGVSPELICLSKTCVTFLATLIVHSIGFVFLGVLLDIAVFSLFDEFFIIAVLVIAGYSALTVLLAHITASSALRGMLLPVVLLPLLFPLLFAALELSADVMHNQALSLNSGWGSLLIGFDLIYLVLCPALFSYVVTE